MKKVPVCVLLILAIFLSGCSRKDIDKLHYYYYGENDEWKAGMIYEAKTVFTRFKDGTLDYKCEDQMELTVTYKGDLSDLSDVKHLEIGYEAATKGGSSIIDYSASDGPRELGFVMKSGGENCSLMRKDEIVTITVNMDGDIQSFDIKVK